MKIILTTHARKRMQERSISRKEIEDCIRNPFRISMETERVRRFQKLFPHGTLEVVAELKGNYFVIITLYLS